jgi:hypothetical protein
MTCELPEVYRVRRPLHDDWRIPWLPAWVPQPWASIPRKWTGRCFPMPPRQIAGNAPLRWMTIQRGYPLAPGVEIEMLGGHRCSSNCTQGVPVLVLTPDPVPPIGCWTMQSVYSTWLDRWIPCFFAFTIRVPLIERFGFAPRRFHCNGPLKPDVTLGDWFWWFELSVTCPRIVP